MGQQRGSPVVGRRIASRSAADRRSGGGDPHNDKNIIRRQRPRVTVAELLAGFDPARHRHDLTLDDPPTGSETPPEAR